MQFRRQHAIDRFMVDFYCHAARLAIEVDGSSHDDSAERDLERTAYLEALDIRVLRFTNREVMLQLPLLVRKIRAALAT